MAGEHWPKIEWAVGYFYFIHNGRKYTASTEPQIGQLLRATITPLSIHNRVLRIA